MTTTRGQLDTQAAKSALEVLTALGDGGRTFHVARQLGWTTSRTRAALKRLESAGRVQRHARFSYENDIYWCPVAEERRNG